MNRIFQKFLQSVIDLSSVRARCCEDNTHDRKKNSREFLTAAAAQVRIRSAASGKNMKRSIQNMRMRY